MKIAYTSDIHFEFDLTRIDQLINRLEKDADVLILAGDIHTAKNIVNSLTKIAKALDPIPIIYVTGNHEFYGASISKLGHELNNAFNEISNLHYLEKESVAISGVNFLGTTLWTGFDAYPEYTQAISEENAMRGVSDFRYIAEPDGMFQSYHCKKYYQKNIGWLEQRLDELKSEPCIVVTHFPPLPILRHGRIPPDSLSNYFQANCEHLIQTYSPIAWIYGHNHWSDEQLIGKTQCLSNQVGYPNEYCNTESLVNYLTIEN